MFIKGDADPVSAKRWFFRNARYLEGRGVFRIGDRYFGRKSQLLAELK
jgi:hypothetical protein